MSASFVRRLRASPLSVVAVIALCNIAAWCWALALLPGRPALWGIALAVYGLGLRHALDADHIAAIDNVTRRLLQLGRRPIAVGLYFALGHSTIVVAVALLVTTAATDLAIFTRMQAIGSLLSTSVSAGALIALALINMVTLRSLLHGIRRHHSVGPKQLLRGDATLTKPALLTRLIQPALRLITHSWHMYPLGILFGLGFDTATEVTMFGLSAGQAAQGVPPAVLILLPTLFASGMALIDTADGTLMLRAYEWAREMPALKLYYDFALTSLSVGAAILIASIEVVHLGDRFFPSSSAAWNAIAGLTNHFYQVGLGIVGVVLFAWMIAAIAGRNHSLERSQ